MADEARNSRRLVVISCLCSEGGDYNYSVKLSENNTVHVLLVHGALGAASQLEPLAAALGSDYGVTVVELEGHGATPMRSDRYSMARFAHDIGSAIHDRAAVFGYSMGGYAALLLAAESPDRVSAVITLGTKLAWTPEVAAKEASRLDPAVIRSKVPKFADQLEERHRQAGGWEAVLGRTAQMMAELGLAPAIDEALLARISQPVRLMVGDRDALVSVEETAAAAKKIGHGELAVLPGTPHPIEQVRPHLIASMLEDFLPR